MTKVLEDRNNDHTNIRDLMYSKQCYCAKIYSNTILVDCGDDTTRRFSELDSKMLTEMMIRR